MGETETEEPKGLTAENGWVLRRPSWPFHRSLWKTLGRAMEFGEFKSLLTQIRDGRARLLRFGDQGSLYRVALRDGMQIQVLVRQRAVKGKDAPEYDLIQVVPLPPKKKANAGKAPARKKPRKLDTATQPEAPSPPPPDLPAPPDTSPPPLPLPAPPQPAPPVRTSMLTLGTRAGDAAKLLAERLRPTPLPPRVEKVAEAKQRRQEFRPPPPPRPRKKPR